MYGDDVHHLAAFRAGLEHVPPPARVVDLGTGAGDAAAAVASRHPHADVVGIDTSRRMLHVARQRHELPNLSFRRCSVTALPFPDGTIDLVTCVNAVPDPVEVRRVLAPGGYVLAAATTVPVRDATTDWVARWHATGFRRKAAADVDGGSWELYGPAATRE